MSIKVEESELLALLGEHGEHWVKDSYKDDIDMCLHGAIRRCAPQPGDALLIEQVAARQGWGITWNDADSTNWIDIRDRLAHVEVTDDDLADTFGPQWEQVAALVRRAAVMTTDEGRDLAAANARMCRSPEGMAACDAVALDAPWDAAARTAAWAAVAWDAAWDAARDTAGDTARALAARHLISSDGFTQAHYDLLTGPWADVISPVHPDDEAS